MKTSDYNPDYTVPPIDILDETIEALGTALSDENSQVVEYVRHFGKITPTIAAKIEKFTRIPCEFWINADVIYRDRIDAVYSRAVTSIVRRDTDALRKVISGNETVVNASHGTENVTLLHIAAMRCDSISAGILCQAGADVNTRDATGSTALHHSAALGDADTAKILINHHADVNARNLDGFTALHNAVAAGIGNCAMIEFLLGIPGVDKNCKTSKGYTPVRLAVSTRSGYDLVKFLINHGLDFHDVDNRGVSPYGYAMTSKRHDIAALLDD